LHVGQHTDAVHEDDAGRSSPLSTGPLRISAHGFPEVTSGKTAVLISHRFSSVRMADRILVLADGIVEAAGTHDELMEQSGRYSELFELQAAGYR
jgi:hypothetical protein